MAGHSQFKNIMHRKGAQDKRRAKKYTKIMRDIMVAAKTGLPDPNSNAKLRSAINAAKAVNMPKDKIEAAIKKATNPQAGSDYEAIRYEGYAPGGIAVIVEALTDNRNRTAPEVRAAFTKFSGNLAEMGAVSFMFEHVGLINYPVSIAPEDKVFEEAVEAGAVDCSAANEQYDILTEHENFAQVKDSLTKKFGEPSEAKFIWKPKNLIEADLETAKKVMALIELLEDSDDIQEVFTNMEVSDETAKGL